MSKKTSRGGVQHHQPKKSMPSVWLIGGIVLVGVAVLLMVWFAASPKRDSGGTPQIQVSAERLDLGKQVFNQPVRASFTVTNAGSGTLMLQAPPVATVLEGC